MFSFSRGYILPSVLDSNFKFFFLSSWPWLSLKHFTFTKKAAGQDFSFLYFLGCTIVGIKTYKGKQRER